MLPESSPAPVAEKKVLGVEVNAVRAETAERALDRQAYVLQPAVHAGDAAVLDLEAELGREDDAVALALESAGEQLLVSVGPYTSAVSKNVTPSSRARWMVAIDSRSSRSSRSSGVP